MRPVALTALLVVVVGLAACGGETGTVVSESGSATSVVSVGGRTVTVKGAKHETSVAGGAAKVSGAGHEIRVEREWITVDGDRRPLPAEGVVEIDLAPERVIVSIGGKALAFTR